MIFFKTKPEAAKPAAQPAARAVDRAPVNTPERSEETAAVRRKKSDSDGTVRRSRQTAEDNRLL